MCNCDKKILWVQLLSWDVGKINPQKLPSLKGSMSLQAGASKPDENPTINIQFKIQQLAISGTIDLRALPYYTKLRVFYLFQIVHLKQFSYSNLIVLDYIRNVSVV